MGIFLAGTGLIAFIGVTLLLVLAFEIWMLVELIQDNSISPEEKILWAAGMLLFHPFVAIAYYFVSRNRHSI